MSISLQMKGADVAEEVTDEDRPWVEKGNNAKILIAILIGAIGVLVIFGILLISMNGGSRTGDDRSQRIGTPSDEPSSLPTTALPVEPSTSADPYVPRETVTVTPSEGETESPTPSEEVSPSEEPTATSTAVPSDEPTCDPNFCS